MQSAFELRTFREQFLTYLVDYRGCSRSTIEAYHRDVQRFIQFLEAHRLPTDVREVRPQHVRAFAASLSGYAPASICRNLDALSSFFGHLQRTGVIDVNPVAEVERPKRPQKLPRAASVEQCQALAAAAGTARDQAMILLLLGTGMRRGELLGLDVFHLAADLSEVQVRGKGERERMLPIPLQCQEPLRSHLAVREAGEPALFVNEAGRRIGTTTFHRWFRHLLRRAGLEDSGLTAHCLRHAYATQMLRTGADLETIRELLGHSNISTTSRYLHTDPSRKRSAVESLPQFAGEGVAPHAA